MVSKRLCVLSVQCSSCREHDGGVQVCDDARHSAGSCDAGLSATVTCLQRRQHMGDLQEEDQRSEWELDMKAPPLIRSNWCINFNADQSSRLFMMIEQEPGGVSQTP